MNPMTPMQISAMFNSPPLVRPKTTRIPDELDVCLDAILEEELIECHICGLELPGGAEAIECGRFVEITDEKNTKIQKLLCNNCIDVREELGYNMSTYEKNPRKISDYTPVLLGTDEVSNYYPLLDYYDDRPHPNVTVRKPRTPTFAKEKRE